MCFVDRTLLWAVFARFDVPLNMLAATRQFQNGMLVRIGTNDGDFSEWFAVGQGLRQGCALNILLTAVLRVTVELFFADVVRMCCAPR